MYWAHVAYVSIARNENICNIEAEENEKFKSKKGWQNLQSVLI